MQLVNLMLSSDVLSSFPADIVAVHFLVAWYDGILTDPF